MIIPENISRCLGALGGLVGGCIIAGLLTVVIILITDSTLGLETIWPGVLSGAVIGALLGLFFPKIGKALAAILNYFP
jgi:hypothetical protein